MIINASSIGHLQYTFPPSVLTVIRYSFSGFPPTSSADVTVHALSRACTCNVAFDDSNTLRVRRTP